jgi:hypothetical protein
MENPSAGGYSHCLEQLFPFSDLMRISVSLTSFSTNVTQNHQVKFWEPQA